MLRSAVRPSHRPDESRPIRRGTLMPSPRTVPAGAAIRPDRQVLLTGASGFVGRRLAPVLEAGGWRVRCVSRNAADMRRQWPDRTWVQADLSRADDVERAAGRLPGGLGLAGRLPAMVLPRWLRTRSEPVAIDDVTSPWRLAHGYRSPQARRSICLVFQRSLRDVRDHLMRAGLEWEEGFTQPPTRERRGPAESV